MSYQSLEGYFASAREQWLAERRATEAEAWSRGVSAEQVRFERREAAKLEELAAIRAQNDAGEAQRQQAGQWRALADHAEQARREAKAQREAALLAAQQDWWANVAQGNLQAGPPMTEDDRQEAQAKRERDAALDRQWAWEDRFRERYGRYPTDAEIRGAGMLAKGS
jgi:hypothetical protein